MVQIVSALFFVMLFIGCGTAMQRMIADYRNEITAALFGSHYQPVSREFRVTVRLLPAHAAAVRRATA